MAKPTQQTAAPTLQHDDAIAKQQAVVDRLREQIEAVQASKLEPLKAKKKAADAELSRLIAARIAARPAAAGDVIVGVTE
jgi:hypothetical protein